MVHDGEDLAEDVRLQGSDNRALRLALCKFAVTELLGAFIQSEAGPHDNVGGPIQSAIPTGVDAVDRMGSRRPWYRRRTTVGGKMLSIRETPDVAHFRQDRPRNNRAKAQALEKLGCQSFCDGR